MCKNNKAKDKEAALHQLSTSVGLESLTNSKQIHQGRLLQPLNLPIRVDKLRRHMKSKRPQHSARSASGMGVWHPASVNHGCGPTNVLGELRGLAECRVVPNLGCRQKKHIPTPRERSDHSEYVAAIPQRTSSEVWETHLAQGSNVAPSPVQRSSQNLPSLVLTGAFNLSPDTAKEETLLHNVAQYMQMSLAGRNSHSPEENDSHHTLMKSVRDHTLSCGFLFAQGQYAGGRRLFDQAAQTFQAVLKQQHWSVITKIFRMFASPKWDECVQVRDSIFRFFHEMSYQCLGKDHCLVEVLRSILNAETFNNVKESVFHVLLEATGTESGACRVAIESDAIALLEGSGFYDVAEQWAKKAIERRMATYGEQHLYARRALSALARVYYGSYRDSEATPLFQRVLDCGVKDHGTDHYDRTSSNTAICLANLYGSVGDFMSCERVCWGLVLGVQNDGPNWQYGRGVALLLLERMLKDQARFTELEELYQEYGTHRDVVAEVEAELLTKQWPTTFVE